MFTGAIFILSFMKFLDMCKPITGWLNSTEILWKWASKPTELAGDDVCRLTRFHPIRNFLCKLNFSFFKAVSSNRLSFYLRNPRHIISSLLGHFCLFQNAISHKMLKLGFFSCKPIFLEK